jgi:hypothetical protein
MPALPVAGLAALRLFGAARFVRVGRRRAPHHETEPDDCTHEQSVNVHDPSERRCEYRVPTPGSRLNSVTSRGDQPPELEDVDPPGFGDEGGGGGRLHFAKIASGIEQAVAQS